MQLHEPHCLHVALTLKLPDLLMEQTNGMHIAEIAKKTGVDEDKLGRILRLLASTHVFREGKFLASLLLFTV